MTSPLSLLLSAIPDWSDWKKAEDWLNSCRDAAASLSSSVEPHEIQFTEWKDFYSDTAAPFGLYSSSLWQKFVLAVFAADLVSYTAPEDIVDFNRLCFAMHAFPSGFRIVWIKLQQHSQGWPVGYTAWHPISAATFDTFRNHPERVQDRVVTPHSPAPGEKPYLYLFNFSVCPSLKKTRLSRILLTAYAQDIHAVSPQGLSCITVSDDGIRVAQRFGMSASGQFTQGNTQETIMVTSKNPA